MCRDAARSLSFPPKIFTVHSAYEQFMPIALTLVNCTYISRGRWELVPPTFTLSPFFTYSQPSHLVFVLLDHRVTIYLPLAYTTKSAYHGYILVLQAYATKRQHPKRVGCLETSDGLLFPTTALTLPPLLLFLLMCCNAIATPTILRGRTFPTYDPHP